jgi:hypothetical protein
MLAPAADARKPSSDVGKDTPPTRASVEEGFGQVGKRMMASAHRQRGHEVRNWVVAHATAGNKGFELISYAALEEIYVGGAFAEWRVAA